ncbi:putative DNA-directed RNA polymerase I 190 kDa polypeptide [Naematelia encephala]|uniref:DNA-directed RNA polymerase subunit n=1 Tax=Naematelia encephala TaxID=71784 RepID=A0A1Y2AQ05_9TREE|nr:putative DNA-directed RNA polymerase I 190 kDa polypeptide [Naematelia encephala]
MDIAHPISTEVTSISFSYLTSEDIRSISVKKVDNPVLLDNLNLPTKGGLYDPKLGPMGARDVCETCHLSYFACPGHFGHIELPVPLYNPLFMPQAYKLLQNTCLYCHHFKMPELTLRQHIARLQLLDAGLAEESHVINQLIPIEKGEDEGDDEDDQRKGAAAAQLSAQTAAEYILRIENFTKHALSIAKRKGTGKDAYKEGLVFEERKQVMHETLAASGKPWARRCLRCQAFAPTFRKEKSTKIIELELDPKRKLANATVGLKRRDVVGNGSSLFKKSKKALNEEIDEGIELSSEGSSAHEDNEMESDHSVNMDDEDDEEEEDEDEGINMPKTASGKLKTVRGRNERVMAPGEVRQHLRLLFQREPELCGLLFGRHGGPVASRLPVPSSSLADMFFLDVVPVTPTRFRPASRMGDDLFENAQNSLLSAVITTCQRIKDLNQTLINHARAERGELVLDAAEKGLGVRSFELLLEALIKLQNDVNSFIDSSKNPTMMRQGKLPPPGIKQLLEKKEGLFRKHMMGKRVNYAARSVISPDINIETNEIGIPPVFARKLTYPEPVTPQNVAELRQLVINGPKHHPGAALVQNEDGTQISLDRATLEQRTAIANQLLTPQGDYASSSTGPAPRNKKVYRHIRDGDIVILNRQPTLHKPSMMAHKVKVLLGEKTIRMHYANCNSYNADFDGDEMNIHFPQNEVARSEAYNIANTDNQYLVPTSGNPLRGLIQDHVVAGVWMCNKSSFFTREEYFQLIYGALRTEDKYSGDGRILTLPPAIWKPRPMWTGKQIMSTILTNLTPSNAKGLNLTSRNKVQNKLWARDDSSDPAMSEENTIFLDGHLICGVLDKSQYGASAYGLVHSVHELYGPMIANRLLGVLSRLLTKFLQHNAFSCRMDDLILTAEGEKMRKDILDNASGDGAQAAIKYVGLPDGSRIEDPETAKNLAIRLEEILRDDNLMAGLDSVMQASFNKTTSKINNDVLPAHLVRPFPKNNMQMMTISGAKGSKVNASQISTLLGQQALEGRRVPTMVSGKTLPSFKPFDTSARAGGFVANRFLTGIRPQEYYFHCMAGREGLIDTAVKTSRSGYLQRCLIKHLEGVRVHYDHTVRDSDSSVLQFLYGEDSLDVTKQKHLEHFDFAARNHTSLVNRFRPAELVDRVVLDEAADHMKKALKRPHKYEPALSKFSPSRYLGSMSESYAKKIAAYIEENKLGYISKKGAIKPSPYASERITDKEFTKLARVRYLRGLVDPGEAVGLLASQGVGEPSTQMTLNTFHLAGHGAANVTLGIPRLREIVMTAAKFPMTPTMKLPLRETVTDIDTERFIKHVSKLTLSQVIERVTVTERLSGRDDNESRLRKYTVLLEFYPAEEYSSEYDITPEQLHESLAFSFAKNLKTEIQGELRMAQKTTAQDLNVGKGLTMRGGDIDGEDVEEDNRRRGRDDELDDDDLDAYQAKRQAQTRQHEYEVDEPEDTGVADLEDYVEQHMAEDASDSGDEMEVDASAKAVADAKADLLVETFKKASKYTTEFSFDGHNGKSAQFDLELPASAPKLLLVDIVERTCRNSIIHEVPGISRSMKIFNDKGEFTRSVITEGSNISGMWSLADELVDLDRLGSNDIWALMQAYGVEAGRRAIIDEMSSIFGAYGIGVDYRHLTIIADYMTHAGGYRPFNRGGISNKSSTLLKASFETTVGFLSEAVIHGDFDDLTSPAAQIVMGKPSGNGTGSFDIRAPRRL